MQSSFLFIEDYKIKVFLNSEKAKIFGILQYKIFIQYLTLYGKINKYIHLNHMQISFHFLINGKITCMPRYIFKIIFSMIN